MLFYKALYPSKNLLLHPLVFLLTITCIVLCFVRITLPYRLIKSASCTKQESFTDQKYLLPLMSCGDFLNTVCSPTTTKRNLKHWKPLKSKKHIINFWSFYCRKYISSLDMATWKTCYLTIMLMSFHNIAYKLYRSYLL